MDIIAETVEGFEEECKTEIGELIDSPENTRKVYPGYIGLEVAKKDIYRLNYGSGTINRIVAVSDRFELEDPEDCYERIDITPSEYIEKDQTFAVKVVREGEHDFSSVDVAKEAGQKIVDRFRKKEGETLSVDLDNPDIVFRLYLFGKKAYFGIDTTGRPLNDRNYMEEEPEVPPILANCLVRSSNWEPGEKLLDPFTRQGVVAIEAGRIESKAPNTQRKFGFLDSKFFSNRDYAEIAAEMNDEMKEKSTEIKGSDKTVSEAERNAERANVKVEFEEVTALEQDVDSYHIVFDAPYLPEKSKRAQIAGYLKEFEQKLYRKNPESVTCTSRSEEFFEKMEKEREVVWDTFRAEVFRN